MQGDLLAVHVLDSDDGPWPRCSEARQVTRWTSSRARWSVGPGGFPLLEECSRRFVGRILDRLDFGDHTGFLLDPFEVKADDDGPALGRSQVVGLEPGHEA